VPGRATEHIDLTNARHVRDLLSRHGVWLTKVMGQHLLVDRDVLERIVQAAALTPETEVLEVGPGVGVLTRELSRAARHVIAVEVDRRMVDVLRETGERHDKSPSQVALRWLIQHDGVLPIPGAKNAGQAVENAGACEQPLIDRPAVPCSLHRDQP